MATKPKMEKLEPLPKEYTLKLDMNERDRVALGLQLYSDSLSHLVKEIKKAAKGANTKAVRSEYEYEAMAHTEELAINRKLTTRVRNLKSK